MRFRQLNSDPNSVMRKKLVKSKKNWIVVSSLSLAGGLFLLGGPTNIVKADADTASVKTAVVSSTPSASSSSDGGSSTTSTPSSSETAAPIITKTTSPVSVDKGSVSSDAGDTKTAPTSTDTTANAAPTVVSTVAEKADTDIAANGDAATDDLQKDTATPTPDMATVSNAVTTPESTTDTAKEGNSLSPAPTADSKNIAETNDTSLKQTQATDVKSVEDSKESSAITTTPTLLSNSKLMLASDAQLESNQLADASIPVPDTLDSLTTTVPVTPASGNGWNVDETGTILNITGQLDEGTAKSTNIDPIDRFTTPTIDPTVIDDSSLQESKTNILWGGNAQTITTINVSSGAKAPTNSSYLFSNMPKLTTITGLNNLDTSKTTNMQGMFKNDGALTSVNLSGNNLSSVTNMSHMFENNSSLVTTTYPVRNTNADLNKGVSKIISTTSQYANDFSLTDPGVRIWQTHHLLNTAAMFKNDNKIKTLDLGGWIEDKTPDTGDSSIGQGMFDGTNLDSIILYHLMYFSPKTALTSNTGSNWVNADDSSQTFSGIPTESNGGIGSLFKGSSSKVTSSNSVSATFTAQPGKDGDITRNLITVQTNRGSISFEADGTIGGDPKDVSSNLPSQITVDGKTYNLKSSQTVNVIFGQTMPTDILDANGKSITDDNPIVYVGKDVASGPFNIKTSVGTTISIHMNAGNAWDSVQATIPSDQIPDGYHLANGDNSITVNYTDNTDIPFTSDTTVIQLIGDSNTVQDTPKFTNSTTGTSEAGTLTDGKGNVITVGSNGQNGDKVTLIIPSVGGYTTVDKNSKEVTKIEGTLDKKGNFIPNSDQPKIDDINYVPNLNTINDVPKFANSITNTTETGTLTEDSNHNTLTTGSTAHTGDKVTLTIPSVGGYTALDKDGNKVTEIKGTLDENGNFVPNDPNIILDKITYKPNTVSPNDVSFNTTTSKPSVAALLTDDATSNTLSHDSKAHTDDKVTLTLPTLKGYTPLDQTTKKEIPSTVKGTLDGNGNFIPDDSNIKLDNIKYEPNMISPNNVSFDTTTSKPSVAGSLTDEVTGNILSHDSKAHTDDKVILTLPDENNGYSAVNTDTNLKITSIKGTLDDSGNFIPDDSNIKLDNIKYEPDTVSPNDVSFNTTTSKPSIAGSLTDEVTGNILSHDSKAHTDDKVTLTLPTSNGYTPIDQFTKKEIPSVIKGSINKNGDFVPDDSTIILTNVKYEPEEVTISDNTFINPDTKKPVSADLFDNTSNKSLSSGNKAHTDDEVTLTIPQVNGYTTTVKNGNKVTEIVGTLDSHGIFVPNDGQPKITDITYQGIPVTTKNPVFTTKDHPDQSTTGILTGTDGKEISAGSSAHNGEDVTLTLPTKKGYTATDSDGKAVTKILGTLDTAGDFVPKSGEPDPQKVQYVGNNVDYSEISVPTNIKDQPLKDLKGQVGTKSNPITLPHVDGYEDLSVVVDYTPDGPKITNVDGSPIDENNKAKYLGVLNKGKTIEVKNPDGTKSTLTIPDGRNFDDSKTITADAKPGYKAPSVTVTYTASGTPKITYTDAPNKEVSDTDVLTYTKNPSHSSGSHNNNNQKPDENPNSNQTTSPEQNVQNIATFSEKGQINVYALGSDNKMSAVGNRGLAHQSTWYSDQKVTVDGIQYYRVATNEWVKASQVYTYKDANFDVRTYDKTARVLYKSEDEVINSRMLAPNTSWFSDRITYVINGEEYYRVATNEFVSAKDAYIYEPTNMVVTTHKDTNATALYSAKGEYIGSRSLAADSSWLVDSITYINGVKYYRVATNEFVKASDVDVNH